MMLPSNFHQDLLPTWRTVSVRDTGPAFLARTCTGLSVSEMPSFRRNGMRETLAFRTLGIGNLLL